MIDHARVARDVVIAASVTGTTATLVVNTTVTTLTAATVDELRASLVRRVAVVATAIDLPVQVRILTNGRDEVLLVAPDGETESIGALLSEPARRSMRALPALVAAVGVTAAALVGGLLVVDSSAPGRSPVTAVAAIAAIAEGPPPADAVRPPATITDRIEGARDRLALRRRADVRVVSSGPAVADGLSAPVVDPPPVAPEPAAPTTVTPVTTAPPVSTAPTNDGSGGNHSNDNGGDATDPPEPVDPGDVPDPIDPDDR